MSRHQHAVATWTGDGVILHVECCIAAAHAGVMHFTSSCRGDLLNGGFAASQQLSPQCCELPFRSRREAVRGGHTQHMFRYLAQDGLAPFPI